MNWQVRIKNLGQLQVVLKKHRNQVLVKARWILVAM